MLWVKKTAWGNNFLTDVYDPTLYELDLFAHMFVRMKTGMSVEQWKRVPCRYNGMWGNRVRDVCAVLGFHEWSVYLKFLVLCGQSQNSRVDIMQRKVTLCQDAKSKPQRKRWKVSLVWMHAPISGVTIRQSIVVGQRACAVLDHHAME